MGDVGKSVKLVFNISNLKGWRGIQPLTEFSESTEKHKKWMLGMGDAGTLSP